MLPILIIAMLLVVLLIVLGKKSVKLLPWIFAVSNAVLTLYAFGAAYFHPDQYGMSPILIFILDFPATFLGALLESALLPSDEYGRPYEVKSCIIYLIVGFLWFFCIGKALRWIITKQSSPADRDA